MLCPHCRAVCTPEDNYCHRCGQYLRVVRLPVRPAERGLSPLRAVAPALVRSGTYLLLGVAGQWALRQLLRLALSRAAGPRRERRLPADGRGRLPAPTPTREEATLFTYRETTIVRRTLRHR
ncbi:MAG TPA: zinc ribbon domain-containing protein [Dehalococcoidia bacterium]|nr:zinc ribbon domain-containing protein [Dehalococcoidia bacterium]